LLNKIAGKNEVAQSKNQLLFCKSAKNLS